MGFFLNAYRYAATLTYLLKTNFAGATPATLANGQVLDTAAEGVVTGSLTVVDTSTGINQIADNALKITGTSPAAWDVTGHGSALAIARAEGRVYKVKLSLTGSGSGDSSIVGLNGTSGSLALSTRKHTFVFGGGLALYCTVGNGSLDYSQGAYAAATEYQIAIVLRATGAFYFIKGGVYSTWTLLVVDASESTANLYAAAQCYSNTRVLSILAEKITETLYPDLVQTVAEDSFTDTNGIVLTSHTPEKGGAWTRIRNYSSSTAVAQVEIEGNLARCDISSGSGDVVQAYVMDTGVADVLVTADITLCSFALNNEGLYARANTTPIFTAGHRSCRFTLENSDNYIRIAELYDTTGAVRASTASTLTVGNTYPSVQLLVVGTTAVGIANGATVTATLSNQATDTFCGVETASASAYVGTKIDNFKVYPATGYDSVLDAI